MRTYTLESAAIINHALSLLALAGIYSDNDKRTAAECLKGELNPDMEPQERATLRSIIALFETN